MEHLPAPFRAAVILALPTMWVILFFLKRNSIPLLSLLATSRERPRTLSQSMPTVPLSLRPQKSAFWSFLHELGVGEEGLRGDAAPVEADAAELGALDAGDVVAELGGADGADVAGGAAADDDEIEVT
jgi:hypothetical protein